MLRAPDFPAGYAYLFELYAEFMLWAPRERPPEWTDFQAWASMMRRYVTPWDLRALRQIHDAHHRVIAKGATQ